MTHQRIDAPAKLIERLRPVQEQINRMQAEIQAALFGATIAANTAISNTQLPAAARPSAGRSFACMGSISGAKAAVRIYVDTNGYIRPQDGFGNTDWLSVEFTYFTGG